MNALELSALTLACLPLIAAPPVNDDEIDVIADVVFNGDPPGGVEIDLGPMLDSVPDYVPSSSAIWAATSDYPRPSAGDRPDNDLLQDFNLDIPADGWDPDAFTVAWDASAAPDRVWCYVTYVLRHETDSTQPNKKYYFIAEWPIPDDNDPVITYAGWPFIDFTPAAPTETGTSTSG